MKIRSFGVVVLSGFLLASVGVLGAQETARKNDEPKAITLPATTLDQYVGEYRAADEPDLVSSVYREGD
jgi:hypothetical protein